MAAFIVKVFPSTVAVPSGFLRLFFLLGAAVTRQKFPPLPSPLPFLDLKGFMANKKKRGKGEGEQEIMSSSLVRRPFCQIHAALWTGRREGRLFYCPERNS